MGLRARQPGVSELKFGMGERPMKPCALRILLFSVFSCSVALAQINCSSGSAANKLVCEFPFATGALTNASALGQGSGVPAGAVPALGVATGLNVAVATQLSQLPLASASAGTVVAYKNGVPETFNNLGPILVDRAQTVGKGKVFLGVTASQYVFTDIDGKPLSSLQFSYSRYACAAGQSNCTQADAVSTTYTQEPQNRLAFVVDQLVAVATFGLTNKLDYSVIVPVARVSLGSSIPSSTNYVVNSSGTLLFSQPNSPSYAYGTASGVGDVETGFKYSLYAGEHATVSTGSIFRLRSGDELNLLGSGAWGFNPFLTYSYLAKFSPHAKIGYQWNTDSDLNNPTYTEPVYNNGAIVAQPDKPLPGGVQYDIGGDWAVAKRFTVALDLLGYQFINSERLVFSTAVVNASPAPLSLPTTTAESDSYSINNVSAGFKWNPGANLVLSANVLTQINNDGLRARPTPLLGIGYKF
jgi:hypothetical protein